MKLDKLAIEVEPWLLGENKYELRIRIITQGKELTSKQILDPDDFESRFDFTFDRAKEILRRELKKVSSEVSPT